MKNKNYYSIHKNKKKRKATITKQMEALKAINRVIVNAIVLAQKMVELKSLHRSIPKYTGPNNGNYPTHNTLIYGTDLQSGKSVESVILPNGKIVDLYNRNWFDEHTEITPEMVEYFKKKKPFDYKNCLEGNPFVDKDLLEKMINYKPNK